MMAPTHVFAGLAIAAAVATAAPEFARVAVAAGAVGGLFPDLDLYAGHRKTLHFPVYYATFALAAVAVAAAVPTAATVAVAVFLLAAALHCVADAFGGGLELKPWLATSERAVYDHYSGRWIRPRRWIRYDGAPEDLVLAAVLAVPALVVFDGPIRNFVFASLAVAVVYTAIRKPLVVATERLLARAPDDLVARLPERFLPIEEGLIEEYTDG